MRIEKYKTHNFCTRCTKWIPKGEVCEYHPKYKLRTKRQQGRVALGEPIRID